MCRLEKKVTSLEEAKRELDNRKMASDQILQSHNATVADLRQQLDKANREKVQFNIQIGTSWALYDLGRLNVEASGFHCAQTADRKQCLSIRDGECLQIHGVQLMHVGMLKTSVKLSWIL